MCQVTYLSYISTKTIRHRGLNAEAGMRLHLYMKSEGHYEELCKNVKQSILKCFFFNIHLFFIMLSISSGKGLLLF